MIDQDLIKQMGIDAGVSPGSAPLRKGVGMMTETFYPDCLPLLIGSLPLGDHKEAVELVFKYTPEIPAWVQLPLYPEESMIAQFLPGMPGLSYQDDRVFADTSGDQMTSELFLFFEEYMAVTDGTKSISESRFSLKPDTARGFFMLLDQLSNFVHLPKALKGQITGPFTFSVSIKDQHGRAIYYDNQFREAAVKLIGLKAQWQVRKLKKYGCPVIIFFDEPGLAGFGSSEFISISKDEVLACLNEVIDGVHIKGGLAGIHVCANCDWSVILNSEVDILNFDAYFYFDKFLLYADQIKTFIESGKMIAWGIVPTLSIDAIEAETADSLMKIWDDRIQKLTAAGIDKSQLMKQSFITPSCGMGSLNYDHALKVLTMTRELSDRIRNNTQ
jgi:methionine synthase II (cobalamin-independent)